MSRLTEGHPHREVVNYQRPMQLVLDENMVAIMPLAALQRLQVSPDVREARHNVCIRLPLDVFWVPQDIPNDHTDNER